MGDVIDLPMINQDTDQVTDPIVKEYLRTATAEGHQPTRSVVLVCEMSAAILEMVASVTSCTPQDFFVYAGDRLEWETPAAAEQIGAWGRVHISRNRADK